MWNRYHFCVSFLFEIRDVAGEGREEGVHRYARTQDAPKSEV